ncbi:tbc1 domain family member 15, partial [Quercus suber]
MVDLKGLARLFMKKDGTSELDVVYPIKSECQAEMPKTRFKLRAGKTLSARRWYTAFSQDGHLDIEKVLRRIQRGGVHPAIKGVVWEFLLGCFDPNSTFEDRIQLREQRRHQYRTWKAECQKMVPVIGSGRFITAPIINDDRRMIEDSSTDSNLQDDNGLMATSLVDSSLDHGRHVSNAVSEKKVIQWKLNLHQIVGVQAQLSALSQIIKVIDPKLHQHLETEANAVHIVLPLCTYTCTNIGSGWWEYLFAFRMLMVLFRREFSFVDSLYLWELMWAMEYNPNIFSLYEEPRDAAENIVAPKMNEKLLKQYGKFERKNIKTGRTDLHSALAVFLVASVLETKNKRLLKEAKGLDDVVKIMSDITGNLDAKKACKEALKIHKKYLSK